MDEEDQSEGRSEGVDPELSMKDCHPDHEWEFNKYQGNYVCTRCGAKGYKKKAFSVHPGDRNTSRILVRKCPKCGGPNDAARGRICSECRAASKRRREGR